MLFQAALPVPLSRTGQPRTHLGLLVGTDLLGATFSLAAASAYHPVGLLLSVPPVWDVLDEFPRILAWAERSRCSAGRPRSATRWCTSRVPDSG